MDLWQRLWQDGRNGYDNKVVEQTWLGVSVNNSNGSGKTSATLEALTWLIGPHGSGDKEAEALSRQLQQRRSKCGLAETAGQGQGVSKKAVIATLSAQIWICGRGYSKTSAMAVTTRWRSELALAGVSATAIVAERRQSQLRRKFFLQVIAAVAAEMRQIRQNNTDSSRTNLAWQQQQHISKATARWQ